MHMVGMETSRFGDGLSNEISEEIGVKKKKCKAADTFAHYWVRCYRYTIVGVQRYYQFWFYGTLKVEFFSE